MSPLCRKPGSLWPLCGQRPREGWGPAARQSQRWLPGGAQSHGAKLWGKRWTLLGGPEGLGVGGRGRKPASAGGGETPHSHGHTGAERSSLLPPALPHPVDGPLPGQQESGAGGAGSGAGGLPPQHSAGTPPPQPRGSKIKLVHGFPTRVGHRCLLSRGGDAILLHFGGRGPSRVPGCRGAALPRTRFPEPPTVGHVTRVPLAGPRRRGPSCHIPFAKSP